MILWAALGPTELRSASESRGATCQGQTARSTSMPTRYRGRVDKFPFGSVPESGAGRIDTDGCTQSVDH